MELVLKNVPGGGKISAPVKKFFTGGKKFGAGGKISASAKKILRRGKKFGAGGKKSGGEKKISGGKFSGMRKNRAGWKKSKKVDLARRPFSHFSRKLEKSADSEKSQKKGVQKNRNFAKKFTAEHMQAPAVFSGAVRLKVTGILAQKKNLSTFFPRQLEGRPRNFRVFEPGIQYKKTES